MKHVAYVFSGFQTGAGLGLKQCGPRDRSDAGWEGALGRDGLEVCACAAGAGKISHIPVGRC